MRGNACSKEGYVQLGRLTTRGLVLVGCLVLCGIGALIPADGRAAAADLGPKEFWARGNVYAKNRLYTDAIAYYTRAIQKNKGEIPMQDVASIFNSRGLAYLNLKDYDKAITDFSNAMELDEKNPEFILNRGGAFLDLKKYARAIDDFSAVIKLAPRNAAAYSGRAKAFQGSDDHDKAIADLTKCLEIEPRSVPALYGMGLSYKAKQQDDKAIEAFDKLLAIEPNHAGASYQKAGIYARTKKIDAACIWLELAVGAGYRDWDSLKNDADFDAIRKSDCYRKIIAGK